MVYRIEHQYDIQNKVITNVGIVNGEQSNINSLSLILYSIGQNGWEAVSDTMFKKPAT